ncbi:MAG: DUF2254 domain-containing protein [Gammaproteobacteria bacterium]|nr:DUF2254 domain-containing protein [Gammaproteobacteria bacterium]MBU1444004.1 DUF2254 domain-containing protein [Gammaproteobacteria bacterium]
MKARLLRLSHALRESFWLVPAAMVLAGILLAFALLAIDRSGVLPESLMEGDLLYNGGGTGARTLLGAIASSAIGVAGTVFSITIAALSLAAGQMGPRLLRNFTRDRGNQVTLGAFLATFSYALMVLRSVRTQDEGVFVPHLSLSVGMLMAFACVATLVYFVGHMASRINVDTVVDLVSDDVQSAIRGWATDKKSPAPPAPEFWKNAMPIVDDRRGYLQQLDDEGLADWAAEHHTAIRLFVRRGDYVFPGAPIGLMRVAAAGADAAIRRASALSPTRGSTGDVQYAVRQLVEVAVRALSPGINDPHTAISVLDRLGTALCDLANAKLPTGVHMRNDEVVLVVPEVSYESLVSLMFHMIRQNARSSSAVLIRMLEVLTAVAACELDPERRAVLKRHADLIVVSAGQEIATASDMADIQRRRSVFETMLRDGPAAVVAGGNV